MINFKENIAKNISKITNIDDKEIILYIEIPPNPEMGDFAFPCFKLAKELKKSPMDIANNIKEKYTEDNNIEKIEVIGGYLNFYIKQNIYVKEVMSNIFEQKENYGKGTKGNGKTVVLDYSSPNIAKPFHIGHLRTTVIGGALYNIYKYMGYKTVGINYLGDWGMQFGKIMAGLELWGKEYDLETQETLIGNILKIYVRYSSESKENAELIDIAKKWFKKLENKDEETVKIWKWLKEASLKNYEKTYKLLNSKFDSYNGEAYYEDKMEAVIKEIEEKGLLEESQGAKIINLEKYDMPPCIILTSTGSTIYATRDITAFIDRIKTYHFDKILYIVGGEQKLHFKQVFKSLELLGYGEYANRAEHISFGLVVDKNGEKIGSRKGNSILLQDILNESINKVKDIIEAKNPELENKEEIAEQIGVGAIIFNDLSNSRVKDEIFDWDMLLNFNGETGPYVQFMYVRTRSIIEKSNIELENIDINKVNFKKLDKKEEMQIIKLLDKFEEILENVINKNEPSILSRYIIDLAQSYSSFYSQYTVMCDDEETKIARLLLTKEVGEVIKIGMNLLGIQCPNKM